MINESNEKKKVAYTKPFLISYGSINAITGYLKNGSPDDALQGEPTTGKTDCDDCYS